MDWQLIIPPLLSALFGLIATILTVRSYQQNKYQELAGISLGFGLISLQPLILLFFVSFPNNRIERIAHPFGQIAISAVILGLLIIWISLQQLSGIPTSKRHYFEVGTVLIGLGYTLRSFQVTLNENGWVINYEPEYAFILPAIPTMLLVFEILWLAYKTKRSQNQGDKISLLVFIGWFILAFSILSIIIERMISGTTLYYLVVASCGILIIAYALLRNPYSIVPKIIGAKYINVSLQESGIPIVELPFGDDVKDEGRSILFSSAMKGIVEMLGELTGKKDIPKEFGYATYKIMIVEQNNLICYIICDNPINPLRTIIEEMLRDINNIIPKMTHFKKVRLQELEDLVIGRIEPVL